MKSAERRRAWLIRIARTSPDSPDRRQVIVEVAHVQPFYMFDAHDRYGFCCGQPLEPIPGMGVLTKQCPMPLWGWDRIRMESSNPFEAAQTSDGRYRLLVEAITDYAIYMLDREGRVTSWNPGARRFKGYEADEIIGQHFSTF
jgi:PAS domain-containing protein